jgi:hypothetical protein
MAKKENGNLLIERFVDGKSLKRFLKKEKNSYTRFILKKKAENEVSDFVLENGRIQWKKECQNDNIIREIHHIQPVYAGGLDQDWNKIILSFEDHTKAHLLLFECYGNSYDKAVFLMRTNQTAEAMLTIRKQNIENARQNKIGRFNSDLQRELGKRPKTRRKSYSRSEYISAALSRGTIWLHSDGTLLTLTGQNFVLEIVERLFDKSSNNLKQGFLKNKKKSYLYTGICKLLMGWFDEKKQKRLYSIGPWQLYGIFITLTAAILFSPEDLNEIYETSSPN